MKRMFSSEIVESDAFLSMPHNSQLLYFKLGMRVDDDGFVGNPQAIIRMGGCSKSDFETLVKKRFVLCFPSGVCVVKHHLMNNSIRADRHRKTQYQKELATLVIKTVGKDSYYTEKSKRSTSANSRMTTKRKPSDNQMSTFGCPKLIEDKRSEEKLRKESKPNNLQVVTEQPVENSAENSNIIAF